MLKILRKSTMKDYGGQVLLAEPLATNGSLSKINLALILGIFFIESNFSVEQFAWSLHRQKLREFVRLDFIWYKIPFSQIHLKL